MQINCLACYLVHINIKCTIDHSKCKISPKDGGLLFNRFHICSRVGLFATPWTVVHQVLLSMGFPRKEYWNALPFPSPGDLHDKGIQPRSPALQPDSFTVWATIFKYCGRRSSPRPWILSSFCHFLSPRPQSVPNLWPYGCVPIAVVIVSTQQLLMMCQTLTRILCALTYSLYIHFTEDKTQVQRNQMKFWFKDDSIKSVFPPFSSWK